MSHTNGTVLNIVGRRGVPIPPPDGWIPRYTPPYHRRSEGRGMWRGAVPGLVLIGLGLALFLAAWAHRRSNHD